jgi:hypothetical protein
MTAALPEVRRHRTREGRLEHVVVRREPGGVVRVLGFYASRDAAVHAEVTAEQPGRPLLARAVGLVGLALRPLSALRR